MLSCIFWRKFLHFQILGVSAAGAVAHNTGQIIAAYVIIQNVSVFVYFPVLIVSGVVMGVIVGAAAKKVTQIFGCWNERYTESLTKNNSF